MDYAQRQQAEGHTDAVGALGRRTPGGRSTALARIPPTSPRSVSTAVRSAHMRAVVRDRRGGDFRPPNTVCCFVRSRRCKPSVRLLRVCARGILPQQSGGQGGRPMVGRGQETQGRGRCSIDAAVSACSSPVQNTEQENTRTKGPGDQRRPAAEAERFRRCSAAGSFGASNVAVPNAAEPRAAAAPQASGSHSYS